MKTLFSTLAGLFLAASCTGLLAASMDFGEGLLNLDPPRLLANAQQQHKHWSGVGRIRNELETLCTATLLDTRDEQGKSGPAYVVTSSHCIHPINGKTLKDLPIKGSVTFNYFDDTLERLKTYPLKTLKWGSTHGVDLALIELDRPLSALISDGIEPLKLAREVPADGSNILALSAPEWNTLHLSACTQQPSQEVVEQPFVWRVTMKNQCQGITSGAFGAPLLERASNTLFGIVSTTTADRMAEVKCQQDVPCEINSGRATWHAGTNYGSPITFLKHCFVEGVLVANEQSCNLYPATVVTLATREPQQRYFVKEPDSQGLDITPRWNLRFKVNTTFYRYKLTRQAIECENPVHYSKPISAKNAWIQDAIDPQTGMHMLCILGVDSTGPVSNSAMRNALSLAVELAEPGTTYIPDVSIVLDKNILQRYAMIWTTATPFMSRYIYKYGPLSSTDCLQSEGYHALPAKQPQTQEQDAAESLYGTLQSDQASNVRYKKYMQIIFTFDQPIRVCTYAFDQANQQSALRTDLLKPR